MYADIFLCCVLIVIFYELPVPTHGRSTFISILKPTIQYDTGNACGNAQEDLLSLFQIFNQYKEVHKLHTFLPAVGYVE